MNVWNLDNVPEGLNDVALDLVGDENAQFPNKLSLSADGRRLDWNVERGTLLILR